MSNKQLFQTNATRWRTAIMMALAWAMGLFIGFVSVFSGIYTTEVAIDTFVENPIVCEFEVNHTI